MGLAPGGCSAYFVRGVVFVAVEASLRPNNRIESLALLARTALLGRRCTSAPHHPRKAAADAKR